MTKTRIDASPKTAELAGQIIRIARSDDARTGDRLFAYRIANRLGISRGPVVAAMELLAEKGIAAPVPNKGFILVQDLNSADALETLGKADDESEAQYLLVARDRLEGRIPDTVSEAELMRRYNLRRADMLRLLERIAAEGWAERLRGYGWRFSRMLNSSQAYAETGRLRMMIEPGGILEPTFRWNADLMEPVREHQARLLREGERFTPSELFRFGCEVHEAIAECSGNMVLLETLRRVNKLRRLFAYRFISSLDFVERHAHEHLRLIDLLEAGDKDAASQFMRLHLHWSAGVTAHG